MTEGSPLYLYRIVPFRHLIDLFESKELHFAPSSAWEDPYERILQHKGANWTFAQCWCRRAVSDAMWRIYSPDRTAVRIRTSHAKLLRLGSRINASHHCTCRLDEVTYLPARTVDSEMDRIAGLLKTRFDAKLALDALFMKREAFDFEAEMRAIVYLKTQSRTQSQSAFRFRFDPHAFIESILFDPRADETYGKRATKALLTSVTA